MRISTIPFSEAPSPMDEAPSWQLRVGHGYGDGPASRISRALSDHLVSIA